MSDFKPDGDTAVQVADPAFLFAVKVGGKSVGDFQAVENLSRTVEPFEYKEGGRNHAPHLLPGQAKYGEVTLRWGIMDRAALWNWMAAVQVGKSFRQDVEVFQLTSAHIQRRVFTLKRAWPIEWKGANLSCEENRIPLEELKLVFEDLTMAITPYKPPSLTKLHK
ncbi:MAG: phage tail protein [Pseudomonadota bacterium]